MRSSHRSTAVFAASFSIAFFFAACGETMNTNTKCTSDSSCGDGKVCITLSGECVTKCTSASSCTTAAESVCATASGVIVGATDGGSTNSDGGSSTTPSAYCQCTEDPRCGIGAVCQDSSTKRCTNKCQSNSDCPTSFSCEGATGKCRPAGFDGGSGTDAGTMDAGTDAGTVTFCSYGSTATSCPTGQLCDFAAGECVAAQTCTATNAQPDVCTYGDRCNSSGKCENAVSAPSCANFTGATVPSFSPTADTGPIIYNVTPASVSTAVCFKGTQGLAWQLDMYRTDNANFPSQLTALNGIFYVTPGGAKSDITAGLPNSHYTANGKTASLKVYICAVANSSQVAGFFLTDGNEVCASNGMVFNGSTDCSSDGQCRSGQTCNMTNHTCE